MKTVYSNTMPPIMIRYDDMEDLDLRIDALENYLEVLKKAKAAGVQLRRPRTDGNVVDIVKFDPVNINGDPVEMITTDHWVAARFDLEDEEYWAQFEKEVS